MKINVAQQLKNSIGDTRYYSVDDVSSEGFPIRGEAKLVLTNRSILVIGRFRILSNHICIRCLDEFEYPVEFEIEEEFFFAKNILTGLSIPLAKDADGFIIGEDHVLDLSEAIRQNFLLNLPANPVCQSKCAGLCQKCGHNLNNGSCHCSEGQIDPRLYPLRELFSEEMVKTVSEVN